MVKGRIVSPKQLKPVESNKTSVFFRKLMENPEIADFDVLDKLIAKYPYTKLFWFMKAKKAQLQDHPNAALFFQQAALLSDNPETLYRYIYHHKALPASTVAPEAGEQVAANEHPSREKNTAVAPKADSAEPIESKEPVLSQTTFKEATPYSFTWWLNQSNKKEKTDSFQAEEASEKTAKNGNIPNNNEEGDPLDQQVREHIFHLQSPEMKLSDKNRSQTIPFKVHRKENPIIEKFIKEEPQITPPSPEKVSSENKARESAMDESGFVSETLATIYKEQGLYHKAIDTYKKLILKFPEKSPYFAELIQELEKQN